MTARPALLALVLLLSSCSAAPAATTDPPAAASTAPTDPPDTGRDGAGLILFQRSGRERTEVALVSRDGSGLTSPWASLPGGDQTNPDPDPSGPRVTFVMNDGETDDLWVADLDGGGATRVLDCVSPCLLIDDPSWSPDGTRIVYSRTVENGGDGVSTLETLEVATGTVEVLLGPSTDTFTAGARWSPAGDQVVFEQVHKVGPAVDADIDRVVLTVVDLDETGHPVRALTDGALFAATADWSPDGRRLVYAALPSRGAETTELFTIASDGGRSTRLTRLAGRGGFASEPTYAGGRVLFSGRVDGSPGEPLLLAVRVHSGRVRSATSDVLTPGRHPRSLS